MENSNRLVNISTDDLKNGSSVFLLAWLGLFIVLVGTSAQAAYYTWPSYNPTIAYDYFDEYGDVPMPTQLCPDGVYDDYTGDPVSTYIDRWWCFRWGSNANPAVTEDAWIPMLERFNDDFDYITNIMRWPRDSRARDGYYSTIYLYGSGLSTDDASNTDPGGWQGWVGGYPMVLASYIPVCAFDPATPDGYQTGAMIHEGIHCILSSMPGCFNSCWFHEGGNTWLQATMEAQRSGSFTGLGWLSAGAAIAPFMPIECYSGWLQDGSFGGPCAQGVDQGGDCTWRNLLGGTQYGECFPHAMEVILGPKSVAWVWRNAEYSGRVLQDMAEAPGGLGETQVRRLIQEYRGRQAFCDFGLWSYAYRQLLNGVWNISIEEEYSPYWINVDPWIATCYVATSQNGSTLTPDSLTLPGWSGANQIPLTIDPSANEAFVTFNPIGANMSCQLVYRDTNGDVKYGEPVSSGSCSIPLANVMNNVVVAVICNTDYIYYGESTRTAKYDYTLTMGSGITGTADINTKWFAYNPSSYTITASAGANGSITPSGSVVVSAGGNQTFTFNPDSGYEVHEVLLNGFSIGSLNDYTLNDVRGDCTIDVTFSLIGAETDPPTPNPATWASAPAATSTDTITMTATIGSDPSGGVEYYFEEISGNPGGDDSGWQSSPTYTDSGLSEATQYTYRVRMRDALSNTGTWSTSESAVTYFSGEMNIALFAAVDTSHVSPWETLEYINDGYTPTSSADDSPDAYGNWDGTNGTWNWVEYDFGTVYQVNSTDIYWWEDGGGILQPTDAYIEYWDGNAWINAGSIGLALDQWNTKTLGVDTSRVRVNMVSTISTGILEWRVWGETPGGGGDTTPPAAPTGLNATGDIGSITLDWADNSEPDLASYTVYRSTTSGSGYSSIASGLGTSDYTDSAALNGTTYYYVVTAVDTSSNESATSSEASASTAAALTGTIIGTTGSWGGNPDTTRDAALDGDINTFFDSDLATGGWVGLDLGQSYAITYVRYAPRVGFAGRMVGGQFQGSNTADFSSDVVTLYTISSTPPEGVMTGQDITDTNGYRYVRYYGPTDGYCNIAEMELYGDVENDTTPPAAPTGLTATAGDGSVSLDWDDNGEPDLMHYNLYRSTTSGSGYASIYSGLTTSDYVDNGVTNGTTYYYVVTAEDTSSNESGYSSEASATPQASCPPTVITPWIMINGGAWQENVDYADLTVGDTIMFGPQPITGGSWSWTGPNGFTAATREVTISNIQTNQAGDYIATYTNDCGTDSYHTFTVTVSQGGGPVVVFSDSFENGEWNGLWTEDYQNDWFDSTQRSVDGSYSAEVDGSANDATLTSISIDLQGNSNATVTFSWLIEPGFDSGEYLAFDVSTNSGTNWTQRAILRGNVDTENVWHNGDIDVTGISGGTLMIRFRADVSRSNEDADVDMVQVTAW